MPVRDKMDPRTRVLLEAPIAITLLRLAAPNVLVMVAQAAAGLVETYFIGKLGTDALAGVALVFPVVMLMQMMSAGAMGGGVASSIAQALGAGRRADANVHTDASTRWRRPDGVSLDQLSTFIAATDEGSFSAGGRRLPKSAVGCQWECRRQREKGCGSPSAD